jgi:hypothetical protein
MPRAAKPPAKRLSPNKVFMPMHDVRGIGGKHHVRADSRPGLGDIEQQRRGGIGQLRVVEPGANARVILLPITGLPYLLFCSQDSENRFGMWASGLSRPGAGVALDVVPGRAREYVVVEDLGPDRKRARKRGRYRMALT